MLTPVITTAILRANLEEGKKIMPLAGCLGQTARGKNRRIQRSKT